MWVQSVGLFFRLFINNDCPAGVVVCNELQTYVFHSVLKHIQHIFIPIPLPFSCQTNSVWYRIHQRFRFCNCVNVPYWISGYILFVLSQKVGPVWYPLICIPGYQNFIKSNGGCHIFYKRWVTWLLWKVVGFFSWGPNHQLILDIMGVGVSSETKYKICNFYIGMQLYWTSYVYK